MTIKLALLKSGEEVISDIGEMVTDKQAVVGYFFTNPYRAILTTSDDEDDEEDYNEVETPPVSIKLLPWLPLANEDTIPVVADWVISIVEPQPKLKELYNKACENYEKRKLKSSSPSDTGNDSDTSGGSPERIRRS